jgi:hypothetical protein
VAETTPMPNGGGCAIPKAIGGNSVTPDRVWGWLAILHWPKFWLKGVARAASSYFFFQFFFLIFLIFIQFLNCFNFYYF